MQPGNGVFECFSRYEAVLWRQVGQTHFTHSKH
jgi:hypothetical protein